MKKIIIWIIIIILILGLIAAVILYALHPPSPLIASTDKFTLLDVTLINPLKNRESGRDLIVANGKIELIRKHIVNAKDKNTALYKNMFVTPGLFEMHTHLPPDNALQLTAYISLLFLAHGVTSIREAGDVDGTAVPAYINNVEEGDNPGPRLFSCGPFISENNPEWKSSLLLKSSGDAAKYVAILKKTVACLKAHDGLSLARLQDLKVAALKNKLPLMGHVPAELTFAAALIPDSQHFFGVVAPDKLKSNTYIARMTDWEDIGDIDLENITRLSIKHNLVHTPTLVRSKLLLKYNDYAAALRDPAISLMPRLFGEVVWHPKHGIGFYRNMTTAQLQQIQSALVKQIKLVGMLHRAGAQLHIGSDSGPFAIPGASLALEMKLFVQAGLTPEQVWAISTWKAAKWFKSNLGSLTTGAPADLLIFKDDPTKSLSAISSLQAVVSRGRLYTKKDMQQKIAEYRQHFNGTIFNAISLTAAQAEIDKLFPQ